MSLLLCSFAFSFALLYFDGMYNEDKVISKRNSRQTFALMAYEFLLVVTYIFFGPDGYQALLVSVYLIGAVVTFSMIHTQAPYNNPVVSKLQSLNSTLNLWTAIMLMMAYVN
jgi:hypothetical protein